MVGIRQLLGEAGLNLQEQAVYFGAYHSPGRFSPASLRALVPPGDPWSSQRPNGQEPDAGRQPDVEPIHGAVRVQEQAA